jgi:ParB/RepB/Spo0J family partition protein
MPTKAKKATAPAAKTGPQPRADINGWVLCPGDNVLVVSPGEEYHGLFGKVDAFPTTLELSSYVQLNGRPSTSGRVLLPNAQLRWMGPDIERLENYRPTRPGQQVRVVLENDSLASAEMKALEGKLGTVTEFGELTGSFSMVTVKFDDPELAQWPTNIYSYDLLVVPTPVVQYVPEPEAEHPAIEEDSDLPFLNSQEKPELALSILAWNLLEQIAEHQEYNVSNDEGHGKQLNELQEAGLIELMPFANGTTVRATAAGIAAVQEEPEVQRTPLDEAADAYKVGLRLVPLASIVVTTNTRKVFDEVALGELAESVKAHGILQPIVLRPHGTESGKYELVAGGRRYRAAQLAELVEVPATVRNLTDREFLEVQLLENLQRVDVRPADEAQAFAKLIANGYSAEEIGLKVGKGEKFVLQRAKLAELAEFWIELLLQERLPLVAAHQVARLPAAAQQIVQRYIEKEWSYQLKNGNAFEAGLISRIISEQVLRELNRAPFPLDDATLYPKAGACLACPKRSCAVPRLFDEPERTGSDLCLDGACYGEKKVRLVARQIKTLTAQNGQAPPLICLSYYTDNKQAITKDKYTEAQPSAEGAVQAVVIEGPEAGTLRWVVVKNAVANHEQKKADRSAEIRKAKIDEANRALLTRHLYTQALNGRVLEQHIEQELYGQLRSQGGPHTPLRLALANDFGWELPEGGEAALRKLTPASNYQGLWAWVKLNVDRLNYEQKLALYFAMLGYNCSTFDSSNGRLTGYAKLAGADTAKLLKLATESVTNTKGKKQEVAA